MRVRAKYGASIKDVPGQLPEDKVPSDLDVSRLPGIAAKLLEDVPNNLSQDALWRDMFSFTGACRTLSGKEKIGSIWTKLAAQKRPTDFQTSTAMSMKGMIPGSSWVDVNFTFSTNDPDGLSAKHSGVVSCVPDSNNGWQIWVLRTILEHFDGHQSPDDPSLIEKKAEANGHSANGYVEAHQTNGHGLGDFEVIIVGAGQNGLSLAGRLGALGIHYLLLERNERVGDNWTNRYDSMHWHTPTEMSNLPFGRTWEEEDPMYISASRIAEGYRAYTEKYNINVWTSSNIEDCSYDSGSQRWILSVKRGTDVFRVQAPHLCLGLGSGFNVPKFPNWANEEDYQGILLHSVGYKNCKAWSGKRGVVVGTGTSGHDVAMDMLQENLSSVTIVQRGATPVFPERWISSFYTPIYNRQLPTDIADRATQTMPLKVVDEMLTLNYNAFRQQAADYYEGLERRGFKVDHDTGFVNLAYMHFGPWHIDIGAGQKIIDGQIKVKSGSEVVAYNPTGLTFADGSKLDADVIVLATGQEHDIRQQAARIIGPNAHNISETWGLNEEGEIRGIMRESEVPGLWQLVGPTNSARFESRFIALQIQADLVGKPLKPYKG